MRKKTHSSAGKAIGSTKVTRNSATGKVLLGRAAFKHISAVEGIKPSKALSMDLERTERMPPAKRLATLSSKYGKKT